jgi:hypothetical protein
MIEWTWLDKGDLLISGALLAVGLFLYTTSWSKKVNRSECILIHDQINEKFKEIKDDIKLLLRLHIDPDSINTREEVRKYINGED